MAEHQITEAGPLLDAHGHLREPGWATNLFLDYRRDDIRAPALSIKEWDYYCISDGHRALAFTIADNAYLGMLSVSFLDLDRGWQVTRTLMSAFPLGRTGLPERSSAGISELHIGDSWIRAEADGRGNRTLKASFPDFGKKSWAMNGKTRLGPAETLLGGTGFEAELRLQEQPQGESMVIATPFPNAPRAFYYNQKINCQTATGSFRAGDRSGRLDPGADMAVLDWGRGVWTYSNTWYWASASQVLGEDRVAFGFNLGCGFGDTSAAGENMLFWRGKAHKIGPVSFELDHADFLRPWRIRSDDGRLDIAMTPRLDRAAETNLLLLASLQHQVFGQWDGYAVLDDGTRMELRAVPGFAEKVVNRW